MLVGTIFCVFTLFFLVLADEEIGTTTAVPIGKAAENNELPISTKSNDAEVSEVGSKSAQVERTIEKRLTPAVVYDQTIGESEVVCQNAEFLARILNVVLPLLARNVSGSTKTTLIVQILKELLISTPQSIQNDEVLFKMNDLLQTLEKYNVGLTHESLRSIDNAVEQIDGVKSKVSFKFEVPTFTNPDCTAELISIINVVQQAISRLVVNPVCRTKVQTAVLPEYDINSILINPIKHVVLNNIISSTEIPIDITQKYVTDIVYSNPEFSVEPVSPQEIPDIWNPTDIPATERDDSLFVQNIDIQPIIENVPERPHGIEVIDQNRNPYQYIEIYPQDNQIPVTTGRTQKVIEVIQPVEDVNSDVIYIYPQNQDYPYKYKASPESVSEKNGLPNYPNENIPSTEVPVYIDIVRPEDTPENSPIYPAPVPIDNIDIYPVQPEYKIPEIYEIPYWKQIYYDIFKKYPKEGTWRPIEEVPQSNENIPLIDISTYKPDIVKPEVNIPENISPNYPAPVSIDNVDIYTVQPEYKIPEIYEIPYWKQIYYDIFKKYPKEETWRPNEEITQNIITIDVDENNPTYKPDIVRPEEYIPENNVPYYPTPVPTDNLEIYPVRPEYKIPEIYEIPYWKQIYYDIFKKYPKEETWRPIEEVPQSNENIPLIDISTYKPDVVRPEVYIPENNVPYYPTPVPIDNLDVYPVQPEYKTPEIYEIPYWKQIYYDIFKKYPKEETIEVPQNIKDTEYYPVTENLPWLLPEEDQNTPYQPIDQGEIVIPEFDINLSPDRKDETTLPYEVYPIEYVTPEYDKKPSIQPLNPGKSVPHKTVPNIYPWTEDQQPNIIPIENYPVYPSLPNEYNTEHIYTLPNAPYEFPWIQNELDFDVTLPKEEEIPIDVEINPLQPKKYPKLVPFPNIYPWEQKQELDIVVSTEKYPVDENYLIIENQYPKTPDVPEVYPIPDQPEVIPVLPNQEEMIVPISYPSEYELPEEKPVDNNEWVEIYEKDYILPLPEDQVKIIQNEDQTVHINEIVSPTIYENIYEIPQQIVVNEEYQIPQEYLVKYPWLKIYEKELHFMPHLQPEYTEEIPWSPDHQESDVIVTTEIYPIIDENSPVPEYGKKPNSQPINPGTFDIPDVPQVYPWSSDQPESDIIVTTEQTDIIVPTEKYALIEEIYPLPIDVSNPTPEIPEHPLNPELDIVVQTERNLIEENRLDIIPLNTERTEFHVVTETYPVIDEEYPWLPEYNKEPNSQPKIPGIPDESLDVPQVYPLSPGQPEFEFIIPTEKYQPINPVVPDVPQVYPLTPGQPEFEFIIPTEKYQPINPVVPDVPQVYPLNPEQPEFEFIVPTEKYQPINPVVPDVPQVYPLNPVQPEFEFIVPTEKYQPINPVIPDVPLVYPLNPEQPEYNIILPKEDDTQKYPWMLPNENNPKPEYIEIIPSPSQVPDINIPNVKDSPMWRLIYETLLKINAQNNKNMPVTPADIEIISKPSVEEEVNVITQELRPSMDNILVENVPQVISSDVAVPTTVDQDVILLIRENIDLIEQKVPEILLNVEVYQYLQKIKQLISVQTITLQDYITIVNQYEHLIEYIKKLNINNDIMKKLLLTMTNITGKSNIIELTYLVRRPTPLVYQPYYYVKYRLPYTSFLTRVQKLLIDKPYLKSDPVTLYKELIALSNVAETSPDLKQYEKEDIFKLTSRNGTLLDAKVVEGEDSDMYASLDVLKDINSDISLDEAIKLIKNANKDKLKAEEEFALNELEDGRDNLNIRLRVDNEGVEDPGMTSHQVINEVLKRVYNLRTNTEGSADLDVNSRVISENEESVTIPSVINEFSALTPKTQIRRDSEEVSDLKNLMHQNSELADELDSIITGESKPGVHSSLDYDYSPLDPKNNIEGSNLYVPQVNFNKFNKISESNNLPGSSLRSEYVPIIAGRPDLQAKLLAATIDAQNNANQNPNFANLDGRISSLQSIQQNPNFVNLNGQNSGLQRIFQNPSSVKSDGQISGMQSIFQTPSYVNSAGQMSGIQTFYNNPSSVRLVGQLPSQSYYQNPISVSSGQFSNPNVVRYQYKIQGPPQVHYQRYRSPVVYQQKFNVPSNVQYYVKPGQYNNLG